MFRHALSLVDEHIGSNLQTITGDEIYDLKNGFYEKTVEYMKNSKNLTGVTELLINMFLRHFFSTQTIPLQIENQTRLKGENGHENEIDIAILSKSGVIKYGISIKRKIGTATWQNHEKNSAYCNSLIKRYGSKGNLIQDLFRLENIKRGTHGVFPTVTIIFEEVERKELVTISNIERDFPFHKYIVLKGNHNLLYNEFSQKLINVE